MEPIGARIYVPDAETRRAIEEYLAEAAGLMAHWGFPPPSLPARDGKYQVVLAVETLAALQGGTAAGQYAPEFCGIIGGYLFLSAKSILGGGDDGSQLTPDGRETLGHELFHAVQGSTSFFGAECPPLAGRWIVEGTAEAVGLDVLKTLRGEEVPSWQEALGGRDYTKRLPVPFVPSLLPRDWSQDRLAAYYTSSFWRYLAEYYASLGAGGGVPGPEPPSQGADYGYLATMLSRGSATFDCVGEGAECDYEMRWLDAGLQSIFGKTLREVYPLFAETLALYGDYRAPLGPNGGPEWRNRVFDECSWVELTPTTLGRVHRGLIPSFEPLSMRCWTVYLGEFDTAVPVEVTVEGPPGGFALADLSAAVAGPPVRADTAFVEALSGPERLAARWIVELGNEKGNHFVLTNVAQDPVATTRMTNLPITFTALEHAAVVSFSSSVSGQDPFDFDLGPPGSGVYEVPSDRVKFAVQYINEDGNACVGGLSLPTPVGDGQDLVTIWGGFPLPLREGDFPIEPPTYSESDFPAPAPVTDGVRPGILGGQVFFSCEHGGCGEEPWGAPVRPINAFRGTFRISKISRMQVIGSLDMVAVDEPVRVSATFVAPLGGPRGLSPGHPCAPVESDGSGAGRVSSPGGGGDSGPQPGDPDPEPGAEPGPDSNRGPETMADPPSETGAEPDAAEPSEGADSGRDPADPRADAREVRTEPLVKTQRMGTIEATVDGEMRTWYVVEALTNTGRYASGRWDAEGAGNMTLVLEGFDTQALPLDGFATGPTGASTYGSYRGSVITITVPVAGDAGSIRMNLAEGESGGTMTYVQDAGSEASGSYATVEGSIQGDWAASDDGSIRLEGRFEGLLRAGGGSQPIRIENGTLTVEGIPPSMLLSR
jgi:hypothetical protein